MRHRIAIATSQEYADLPEDDRPLIAAFAALGISAEPEVWSTPNADWTAYGCVLVRSTWDYTWRYPEFLAWLDYVGMATRIINEPRLLRWNTHKRYLRDLQSRGIAIPWSCWPARGDELALADWFERSGAEALVVKPAVGAGGRDTFVVRRGESASPVPDVAALLAERDVIVQEYIPTVTSEGELSLMFVDGKFTHAVCKRPAAGEFRVQERFGGRVEPCVPTPETIEFARRVLAATPIAPVYARVDLIMCAGGEPTLIELEVFEPSMFFAHGPAAITALAAAVARRLRQH